jgi:signal peptidase
MFNHAELLCVSSSLFWLLVRVNSMKWNKYLTLVYMTEVVFLVYIIIFKTIILKSFIAYIDLSNILFFGILTLIVYKFLGLPKKNNLINYSGGQTLIINFIIYYVFIYFLGLFFGFLRSSYSLKFINIAKNIIVVIIFYILRELYRYIIVRKSTKKNKISFGAVTILFSVLDIIMEMNAYDLSTGIGMFEFISACVIPNLALNMLLCYISYAFNYKLVLMFLFLYILPNYFLPIFPDLGYYVGSIIKLLFIFVCYYQLSVLTEKYEKKVSVDVSVRRRLLLIPFVIPLVVLVGLVSGLFKYHLFAIGSNSMLPYFSRGDAVLIRKLSNDELKNIKVDDVIAFHHNDEILVHRVISISNENGVYKIMTKGDNNDVSDGWILENNDIYGEVEYVIKYIGLPSVELSELLGS